MKRPAKENAPCNHEFVSIRTTDYVEAGGYLHLFTTRDAVCTECHRRIEDIYEEEKERANGC